METNTTEEQVPETTPEATPSEVVENPDGNPAVEETPADAPTQEGGENVG
jgi:hypothetical protein